LVETALLDDLPAAGDVGQPRDVLMHVPSPQRARHGDVLARGVGDEESGDGAEQLCGLGDGAEFKMRNPSGERDVAPAPRQQAGGEVARLRNFAICRCESA